MSIVFVDPSSLTGTQNGVNKVFALAFAPNPTTSLQLFLNGMLQDQGADYTLAGSTVTYTAGHPAPLVTDAQLASYRYNSIAPGSGLTTVGDLIAVAFRIAGLMQAPGQTLAPAEAAEGLQVLNDWLDWLKIDRLAVYAIERTLFTLVPNHGAYAIGFGAGADIAAERPVRIDRASFVFTNVTPNIEVPLEVLNEQEWQALSPKSLTSATPTKLYYESSFPNGIVNLWAVPNVAYQMALYLWQSVNQFLTVNDPLVVVPGYTLAMEYNLAVQLAERYPERQRIAQSSVERAISSYAMIKRANAPVLLAQCESGALGLRDRGSYNIYSNSWSTGRR